MSPLLGVLSAVPFCACIWIWRNRRPSWVAWLGAYLPRVGCLFGIGLFAAGPFLTEAGLGTGEAFNYSLATADAVTQTRAGVFPVLVGQSEFAWNGRIHPLRTAPYLANAASALDRLTLHRFGFWALQNMVLALSLVAGVFSAYACLRRGTGATPVAALGLAAVYGLSPAVLGAAYSMDLYMTVMTVPYLPIITLALARAWQGDRTAGNGLWLAAGLAAVWWAHPPVALWASTLTALLFAPLLLTGGFRGRALLGLAGAVLAGAVLAAFALTSALSIKTFPNFAVPANAAGLLAETRGAIPAAFLPVSKGADQIGDFQLGYAGWLLAGLALGAAAWPARGTVVPAERRAARALLGAVGVALAVTLPVPGLHEAFWRRAPSLYLDLTNQWPMQRLYLVATPLLLFAFALLFPRLGAAYARPAGRHLLRAALAAALLWTGWQAWRFIARGYATRVPAEISSLRHREENIDITIMAYAILRLPASYSNGVMDPAMEPRLLRPDGLGELANNWGAPAAEVVAAGELSAQNPTPGLTLQPGQRYRLRFKFGRPLTGLLRLTGEGFLREYGLPAPGGARGFGAGEGNNHAITVWTTQPHPVEVRLTLAGVAELPESGALGFALERLDPAQLPVAVTGLIPFRATVRTEQPALLETPRLFIPGYEATVGGQPVRVRASPEGLAMVPVPAPGAEVTLVYRGPWELRAAFWLGVGAWAALGVVAGWQAWRPTGRFAPERMAAATKRAGDWFTAGWRRGGRPLRWALALLALAAAGTAVSAWRARTVRNQAGPVRLSLLLPAQQTGRQQPLLTTGRPQAGAFVFVHYLDATHVRVGLDVWNRALVFSEPIATDYDGYQEVTISLGALYPAVHPAVRALDGEARRALKNHVEVRWNGVTVLTAEIDTYESAPADVTPGESRIGGSNTEAKFTGRLLQVERMPVPARPRDVGGDK